MEEISIKNDPGIGEMICAWAKKHTFIFSYLDFILTNKSTKSFSLGRFRIFIGKWDDALVIIVGLVLLALLFYITRHQNFVLHRTNFPLLISLRII